MKSRQSGKVSALFEGSNATLCVVFGLFKKYEEGADLFQRAASAFKRDSLWPDAARCYEQAADAFRHLKGREADAARMYNEAANCHRKDSLSGLFCTLFFQYFICPDAERCMRLCVECQLAGGKLRNAARTFRDGLLDCFRLIFYLPLPSWPHCA